MRKEYDEYIVLGRCIGFAVVCTVMILYNIE